MTPKNNNIIIIKKNKSRSPYSSVLSELESCAETSIFSFEKEIYVLYPRCPRANKNIPMIVIIKVLPRYFTAKLLASNCNHHLSEKKLTALSGCSGLTVNPALTSRRLLINTPNSKWWWFKTIYVFYQNKYKLVNKNVEKNRNIVDKI